MALRSAKLSATSNHLAHLSSDHQSILSLPTSIMKFSLSPLAGLVSLLLAASAQASTQDDFLAEANAAPNGIIKLDSASYERLVSSSPGSPRNYSVTVVLTALPEQFKCQPCQ
jgi:hypothetical protein